jgi:8-oxo-dGTP pyrophosphatase MutT (NUDIX family)
MYKVFFNEKLIAVSGRENITLNKPIRAFENDCSFEDVKSWFGSFIKGDEKEIILTHSVPEKFFELFQSVFITIHAAGGVVLRKNKILFIFRNGKWDLPKGKIEPGEKAAIAAVREVEEECGISGHKIVKQLPSTFHIYQSPYKETQGEWIFKETFWFEMKYAGSDSGTPQIDEGITEVRWLNRNELDTVLTNTYENLKQIIQLYLP